MSWNGESVSQTDNEVSGQQVGSPRDPAAAGYSAEDLPPHSPVIVYARLRDPTSQADHIAGLIRWCYQRGLAFNGAYGDNPAGDLWDVMLLHIWHTGATAIVVPTLEQLGDSPHERQARHEAAAAAGALIVVAPAWELPALRQQMDDTVFGSLVQAGSIQGPIQVNFTVPELPAPPRLLPTPQQPVTWTHVEQVLAELGALAPHDPHRTHLIALSGAEGVGKTTAALRWLNRRDWPDGTLYADLTMTGDTPVTADSVLATWLPILGIPHELMPVDVGELAAYYRSLVHGKRLGVLLDGALSAAQVRPLIPSGPSVVIVTSRRPLTGLARDGARFLQIDDEPLTARGDHQ
jgi:hypothetical protein